VTAATWSAIAASASASAAFLVLVIQRRVFRDSVSPQIVLDGWSRIEEPFGGRQFDVVRFAEVRNIGNGTAFGVHIGLGNFVKVGERPLFSMSTESHVVLAAGEKRAAKEGKILLFWDNIPPVAGGKHVLVELRLLSWDTRRWFRYETIYQIHVFERGKSTVADPIADDVALGPLRTIVRPVWLLRVRVQLQRAWLLGRLFRDE
jgi:hypothetical protein